MPGCKVCLSLDQFVRNSSFIDSLYKEIVYAVVENSVNCSVVDTSQSDVVASLFLLCKELRAPKCYVHTGV
jgi:hypothetical protein